ncbi:MAG: ribosome biogenesis GTPase Der [Desulfobacterota bacterium]|nr:ribosome biogenesis GTPase Der [Thermodesulfobacteriota bacterium]
MARNPIVAIVGRPNVGKSSLFNALAKKNIAIIHDLPGVTRDRNYRDIEYNGCAFTLVDTGGFDPAARDDVGKLVREHTRIAIDEADVIIFLMDAKEGLQVTDHDIADVLRASQKPVIYAVNKVDGPRDREVLPDFYRLGVETIVPVAARNRIGITELLDSILRNLPHARSTAPESDEEIVVSIIGRPNVGKSSCINAILGYERLLVTDTAGTTRDPVDSVLRYHGKTIRFIDTAGIRKKSSISYQLEKYCVFRAFMSINQSTICIIVLDATQGVTTQDAKIASLVCEKKRACILAVNKWDLIEKNDKTHSAFLKNIAAELPFLDYAPILTVSARTGLRVRKILDSIVRLDEVFKKRVPTAALNKGLRDIVEHCPPPRGRRTQTKIYFASQVETAPPTFTLWTNNPSAFTKSYIRHLEREIRQQFGFAGVPLHIKPAYRSRAA